MSRGRHARAKHYHGPGTALDRLAAMLRWSLMFLVLAVIAALFGFTGIASGAASIAQFLFVLFLVLLVVSLLVGRGRSVPVE
jgi:uncharacterized membrane protein YtjA (UPF0391 family)